LDTPSYVVRYKVWVYLWGGGVTDSITSTI